jgi:SNF2 family DNA or RNA helicase
MRPNAKEVKVMGPHVILTMAGNELRVEFPYSEADVDRVKRVVPRLRFKKAHLGGPYWYGKADLDMCRSLRKEFGDRLKVENGVAAWARTAAATEAKLTELALSTAADVPDVELHHLAQRAPALFATLRRTQRAAVAYARDAGAFLLGDEAGFGKTLEALGAVYEMNLPVPHDEANMLVVGGRKIAGKVWEREVAKWLPGVKVFRAERGSAAKRRQTIEAWNNYEGPCFLYVNSAMCRSWKLMTDDKGNKIDKPVWSHEFPELFERNIWDVIILDESHKVLQKTHGTHGSREGERWYEQNPKGRLGEMRKRKKGSMQGMGAMLLALNNPDSFRIAMTATPNPNRTEGLFGTLRWCFPLKYTSYWRFVNEHFIVEQDHFGHKRIRELNEEQLAALYRKLNTVMLRRTKMEDPELQLLPKVYTDVWVEMEGEQERQYKQFADKGYAMLEGGRLAEKGRLSAITRLRQLAHGAMALHGANTKPVFIKPSCVLDAVMDLLGARGILDTEKSDNGVGNQKVLVWSELEEFVQLVCDELDRRSVAYFKLVGDTTDRQRDYLQDRFQEPGGPRVVVGTTSTGGISITLSAADAVIMCDEMWNWDDNEQAEDRAHRADEITQNKAHNVTVYYIRTAGTIYEYVANVVGGKFEDAKRLLDGRRGVDTTREILAYQGKDAS